MKKKIFIFIIIIISFILFLWLGLRFIYRERMPGSQTHLLPLDPEQISLIDYSVYDGLLRKYVKDGLVDYIRWKNNDFAIFDKYIRSLKYVELDNLTIQERKAFWINAYNALTIYAVLKRMPENRLLTKVFSVQAIPGFFDGIEYEVAGEKLTLNDIENKKLRAGFGDARIHFAIVCASRSCPEIQNSAFKPHELEARLNEATEVFIRDSSRNRLDKENGILYLSQIFRWFEQDFVKASGSVINFVKKFLDESDYDYLSDHEVEVKHLFYNWAVNIKH